MLSQCSECIQHNTRNDIAEENTEENTVYHIIREPHYLEFFHSLADSTWDKELHDTVNHGLTHLICWLVTRIDVLLVVAESDSTEDKSEDNAHDTDIA